jgi:hypothetical protein
MKTCSKLNGRTALALACIAAGLTLTPAANSANSCHQVNLASDLSGVARFMDANLVNPWGLLTVPDGHLIVADNHAGVATFYSRTGQPRRPMLYAANFGQGVVEMYDAKFHPLKSFMDPDLAGAGYVPFGIRNIGGHRFVTYAFKTLPEDGDETAGPGLGYVHEFDAGGAQLRRVASQGPLNAPWGLAMAPRHFGRFSGALLVGNLGDGAINAFHPRTGAFLGQLADAAGNVIYIDRLWGLAFGGGSEEPSLYFTAGPGDEEHGLLGVIRPDVSAASEDRD